MPKMFSFSNKDSSAMEIIRVGNVLPDGSLKDSVLDGI